jgi:hypothetical protein
LIGAFTPDPPRGFPRAPTGYLRPLRGATGALRPRSTWAPIAYYLYFGTPTSLVFPPPLVLLELETQILTF